MRRPGPIRVLLACALALLALHYAHTVFGLGGHDSVLFNAYLYDALMIAAAALCFSRAALIRAERKAWLAFGIGLASYAAGEIYWSLWIGDDLTPPISLADVLYLGFYPPAYIGVVLLARARLREFRRSLWLDGVIGALAVAAVSTALVFDRVLAASQGSPEVVAVTMAYPLADVLLLSIIVALAAVTGWQLTGNGALVACSLVVAAIADGTYLVQSAAGTYQEGYPVDSAWLTANLLLGFAAWLPSRSARPLRLDRLRVMAAPVVFGLMAITVLLAGIFVEPRPVAAVLASVVLLALIARVVLTFRENLALLATSREQALHDPLTGLRNRRALVEDLPEAIERAREGEAQVLVLLDLNGFKAYNDSQGHLAGDALLTRLATNLSRSVAGSGQAYRLGGDEFCAVVALDGRTVGDVAADVGAALVERADGFNIGACFGTALVPGEARDVQGALRIADRRLYAHKAERRCLPDAQAVEEFRRDIAEHGEQLQASPG
jgi:two-component system cell cycle response regulator